MMRTQYLLLVSVSVYVCVSKDSAQEVIDDASKHPPKIELNLYSISKRDSFHDLNKRDLFLQHFQNSRDLGEVLSELHGSGPRTWKAAQGLTIVRQKVKIQQPILEPFANPNSSVGVSNFAPFCKLRKGQATNPDGEKMLGKQSAIGAVWTRPEWEKKAPYHPGFGHRFSLPDFCPNLPSESKGSQENPNDACLKDDTSRKVVQGVLCPEGVSDPTGKPGCHVVLVGKPQFLPVHKLIGTDQEDCGGRVCKNLEDFRQNCTNTSYWQFFDSDGNLHHQPKQTMSHSCKVFLSHPACKDDCFHPQCMAVAPERRDIGVPFWRNRCDIYANQARIEKLAEALGFDGARSKHLFVDPTLGGSDESCKNGRQHVCEPKKTTGNAPRGPYCTRAFSQVCTPCHIPVKALQKGLATAKKMNEFSFCPYDVDLRGKPPTCLDRKPSSGCCLYLKTCEGDSDPTKASLDDNGFSLVAAHQDTAKMAVFLRRFVHEELNHRVLDNASFHEFAYRQWNRYPLMKNMELVQHELFQQGLLAGHVEKTTLVTSWIFIALGGTVLLLLVAFVLIRRRTTEAEPSSGEQVLTQAQETELGLVQQ